MKEPRIKIMGWFIKIITFGWASAITLAPFRIYIRREYLLHRRIIRHENIHWKQQIGMYIVALIISTITQLILLFQGIFAWWFIPFVLFPFLFYYLWYLVEWLIKGIIRIPFRIFARNSDILSESAYNALSFEREAHDNDNDLNYLEGKKYYAWIKRIFK